MCQTSYIRLGGDNKNSCFFLSGNTVLGDFEERDEWSGSGLKSFLGPGLTPSNVTMTP